MVARWVSEGLGVRERRGMVGGRRERVGGWVRAAERALVTSFRAVWMAGRRVGWWVRR